MKVKVRVESTTLEGNEWVEAGTHWNCSIEEINHEIKGCPMGRGKTEEAAIRDLVRRVGYESNVKIIPEVVKRCRY